MWQMVTLLDTAGLKLASRLFWLYQTYIDGSAEFFKTRKFSMEKSYIIKVEKCMVKKCVTILLIGNMYQVMAIGNIMIGKMTIEKTAARKKVTAPLQ